MYPYISACILWTLYNIELKTTYIFIKLCIVIIYTRGKVDFEHVKKCNFPMQHWNVVYSRIWILWCIRYFWDGCSCKIIRIEIHVANNGSFGRKLYLLHFLQDYTKALKYFSLAADQGWVDGQLQLALMYYGRFSPIGLKFIVANHTQVFCLRNKRVIFQCITFIFFGLFKIKTKKFWDNLKKDDLRLETNPPPPPPPPPHLWLLQVYL